METPLQPFETVKLETDDDSSTKHLLTNSLWFRKLQSDFRNFRQMEQ